jgi:hypothetical protein
MADHTQSIANTLSLLGQAPTVTWNNFNWGEENWGYSDDLIVSVEKLITNSQGSTTTVRVDFVKVYSNSLSPTEDLTEQQLLDGSGYNYVFRKPTTDGEDRNIVSWTSETGASSTWTCATVSSDSWSEA